MSFTLFFILSTLFWGVLIHKTWQTGDEDKALLVDRLDTVKQQSVARLQTLKPVASGTQDSSVELAHNFRVWINDSALMPNDVFEWVSGLSEQHFYTITAFTAQFCTDLGFELEGVLNSQYTDGDLDDTLDQIIIYTMKSMRLVFAVREELLEHEVVGQDGGSPLQDMLSNSMASMQGMWGQVTNSQLNGHKK